MAEKNCLQKVTGYSAYTPWPKFFVEVTLSHTISEINAFLHFTQKFTIASKKLEKIIFSKMWQVTVDPAGRNRDKSVFAFYAKFQDSLLK